MRDRGSMSQATPALFTELLQRTIAQVREGGAEGSRDAVLFLGPRHHTFPALIVDDPILEPVDKIIWMVIWQRGAGGRTQALFPTYAEISAKAHIGSDSTIARALAILRATRWLSLCARVRGKQGKFRGNIYAVHDEPLSLTDAMQLDPEYLQFIDTAKTHPHPRVCKVATGVLAALDTDIDAGVDVTAPPHPISRRLEAQRATTQPGAFRYFSFTPEVLRDLINTRDSCTPQDRLQKLETVDPLQKLESVGGSSSVNKTTTTDLETSRSAREPVFIYPEALSDNQRALARRYLERVPGSNRQAVLDELEGRLRAARQGAKPLYDPLRYLHRLCEEVVRGRFVINLGGAVDAERRRRQLSHTQIPTVLLKPEAPKAEKSLRENPVEAIRRQLNLPSRLKPAI